MKLSIRFAGRGEASNEEVWPMANKCYEFGRITLNYSNGDKQEIDLEGRLLRPVVQLNSSGQEGVAGPEVQEFGVVYTKNTKQMSLFLSNTSKVPAKWKIHHVKNPFKKMLLTSATITQMEKENSEVIDDPEVFSFAVTDVRGIHHASSAFTD